MTANRLFEPHQYGAPPLWWHRLGHRPPDDDFRRKIIHPRSNRLPQNRLRRRTPFPKPLRHVRQKNPRSKYKVTHKPQYNQYVMIADNETNTLYLDALDLRKLKKRIFFLKFE